MEPDAATNNPKVPTSSAKNITKLELCIKILPLSLKQGLLL
jgi:hypothetical protein